MIDHFDPTANLNAAREIASALLPVVLAGLGMFMLAAFLG